MTAYYCRHLENVQMPLFILLPSHLTIVISNIQKYHICEVYIFAL